MDKIIVLKKKINTKIHYRNKPKTINRNYKEYRMKWNNYRKKIFVVKMRIRNLHYKCNILKIK